MDWEELLELTYPRLIILVLLFSYCMVTVPVVTMHHESCREKGVNCTYQDYNVSVYYCLTIQFYEEFHTMSLYSLRVCSKSDLLWLFLIIPLLYIISLPVYEQIEKSVYAWNYGSTHEGITFSLGIATLIPAFMFGIINAGSPQLPVTAYVVYPVGLFYACAHMLVSGKALSSLIILCILAVVVYQVHALFKKKKIDAIHAIWICYLVITFFGAFVMH
jgi:hypothetical protein